MRVTILALLSLTSIAPQNPQATFVFAPPSGLECEITSKMTSENESSTFKSRQVGDGVVQMRYDKTDSGYRVTATTKSLRMTRDGQPMPDPISNAMIGRSLVYDIGPDGVMRGVDGIDELWQELEKSMPLPMRAMMAKIAGPEMLRAKEMADWNDRMAGLAGKEVGAGDLWEGEGEQPSLTGTPVKVAVLTRFPKIEPVSGKVLVTIDTAYGIDRESAQRMLDAIGSRITGGKAPVPTVNMDIEGHKRRVIDATTMTMQSEQLSKTIRMSMPMPDGSNGPTMTRYEEQEHVARCNK